MTGFQVATLGDMLKTLGEDHVKEILSQYLCPENKDVELFLKEKAIEFSYQGYSAAAADMRMAKGQPEVLATPEEEIPVEKVEKGGVSWLWIILGLVAVGGIAAAAGGPPEPPKPPDSSSVLLLSNGTKSWFEIRSSLP